MGRIAASPYGLVSRIEDSGSRTRANGHATGLGQVVIGRQNIRMRRKVIVRLIAMRAPVSRRGASHRSTCRLSRGSV